MNYKQHLIRGIFPNIIIFVLCSYFFNWYVTSYVSVLSALFIVFISPLIPDLDHTNSKPFHWLIGTGLIIQIVGFIIYKLELNLNFVFYGFLLVAFAFFNGHFFKHRGFWHSITLCILYAICVTLLFNFQIGILALIGCYSHLVCDGIPFKII